MGGRIKDRDGRKEVMEYRANESQERIKNENIPLHTLFICKVFEFTVCVFHVVLLLIFGSISSHLILM